MTHKLLTASLLAMAALAGCNTGSRDNTTESSFGPGSTRANAQNGNPTSATPTTSAPAGNPGANPTGSGGSNAGRFTNGPALNQARAQHSATRLNDGRVLVTGGSDGQGIIAEAEVFDPTTNTWDTVSSLAPSQDRGYMMDPTGQFATARQLHTATALTDGRILIVGGLGVERLDAQGNPVFENLTTTYTFNPQTNAFARTADLDQNRGWHTAALLSTGRVLIAGGFDAQFLAHANAEVYDPALDTWTPTQQTASKHTFGALLTSGGTTVLVGGADLSQGQQGLSLNGLPAPRVEAFDAQANAFITYPDNAGHRLSQGVNILSIGTGFLAGGVAVDPATQASSPADTAELFDPTTRSFKPVGTLRTPRSDCQVAEVATTSDQLVIGGVDDSGLPLASCELWSVLNNTFAGTVLMAQERTDHRAVTLQDGRILVVGGFDANMNPLDSSEFHQR